VYGEKEAGGTQVLYLAAVNFDLLGLPHLRATEHPSNWLKWQEPVLKYFALPIGIYATIVAFLKQNFRQHEAEMDEEHKKTGVDSSAMTTQTDIDLTVVRWQCGVPVFGVPVTTRNFLFLAAAAAAGLQFAEFLLIGVVGNNFDVGTDLGPDVSRAMPRAMELVASILARRGFGARRRPLPLNLHLWWENKPAHSSGSP